MNLLFLIDFFFKTFLQVNSSPVNRNLAQQRFSQHVHQWPGQRVHRSGESANMFTRDSTNTFYQHIYQANMFTSDFVSMFSSVTRSLCSSVIWAIYSQVTLPTSSPVFWATYSPVTWPTISPVTLITFSSVTRSIYSQVTCETCSPVTRPICLQAIWQASL